MDVLSIDAAMVEVKKYLSAIPSLDVDTVINFVHPYFDLIAPADYRLFKGAVMETLQSECSEQFAFPSDKMRIDQQLARIANLHGKIRIHKEGSGQYSVKPILVTPKEMRQMPTAAIKVDKSNVAMNDELVAELKYGNDSGNNFIESSVDDYLEAFKGDAISAKDYIEVLAALTSFFNGAPSQNCNTYQVKKMNKGKLGQALGKLYCGIRNEAISYDYLMFCKSLFKCYNNIEIDEICLSKNNLYKYFTSKHQYQ